MSVLPTGRDGQRAAGCGVKVSHRVGDVIRQGAQELLPFAHALARVMQLSLDLREANALLHLAAQKREACQAHGEFQPTPDYASAQQSHAQHTRMCANLAEPSARVLSPYLRAIVAFSAMSASICPSSASRTMARDSRVFSTLSRLSPWGNGTGYTRVMGT
eukprot:scaffold4750_cov140-Isochrysis_galbana.AAC.4